MFIKIALNFTFPVFWVTLYNTRCFAIAICLYYVQKGPKSFVRSDILSQTLFPNGNISSLSTWIILNELVQQLNKIRQNRFELYLKFYFILYLILILSGDDDQDKRCDNEKQTKSGTTWLLCSTFLDFECFRMRVCQFDVLKINKLYWIPLIYHSPFSATSHSFFFKNISIDRFLKGLLNGT